MIWNKTLTAILVFIAAFTFSTLVKAEEIVLNFDHFATGPKYYKTGDWYVVLENEEDWEVYLNWYAPEDDYCGTFRKNDFDHDYSYIFTPDNRENGGIHYDNIMMKINIEQVNPLLSRILLTATIQGDDGNTYRISAVQEILNYKDTIETTIMDAHFTSGDGEYTIVGKNDDLDIYLTILSDKITGVFNSIEFFDISNSRIVYQGDTIHPLQIEGIVDVGLVENNVLAYGAQIHLLSTDTVMYHIMLSAPFPTPTDTITIQCHNLSIEDTWAETYNTITMNAHNANYEILIMYSDKSVHEATYTEAEAVLHITDRNEGIQVESLLTNMRVSKTDNGQYYQADIQARCTDNKIYNIYLSWDVPTPQDTIQIAFDYSSKSSYYTTNNDLLLVNQDDKYELSLNVFGIPLGGKFTLDNMGSYTHIYVHSEEIEMADVQGTIYQTEDTTWIKANIIGFDSILYQTALWHLVPTPTDTIQLTLTDVPFNNHLQEGYFHLFAYTADSAYAVSLMPATHQVEGVYVNDGLFGRFGEGQYHFFNDYTSVAEWNPMTHDYDVYTVDKGELVVQMDENDNIIATASVICENAKLYQITITSHYERPHLEWDTESGDVNRTYTASDIVSIDNQVSADNLIVFAVEAANHADMMVLYLFTDKVDEEIGLPIGTFPINSSCANGTILASTGANEDGSVSPSLYSTIDGEYLDKLYFFVDGTVEIIKNEEGKPYIDVHAINSYSIPIHVVYDASATDLNNIFITSTTEVQKIMIDGQLVIIRNGKAYNAVGAQVK